MLQLTDVVKNLLIINVLFFLAQLIFGEQMTQMLALHHPDSTLFKPVQLATHFFMHGDFWHLFFNMFALIIFGPILEHVWGAKQFLFYFFVCAIGASIIYMLHLTWQINSAHDAMLAFQENSNMANFQRFLDVMNIGPEGVNMDVINQMSRNMTPAYIAEANGFIKGMYLRILNTTVLGASGAIYGLVTAFGMLFPDKELRFLFIPVSFKAKYLVIGLLAYGLYQGLNPSVGDNTAHFAHLGGAATGALLVLYWRKFGAQS